MSLVGWLMLGAAGSALTAAQQSPVQLELRPFAGEPAIVVRGCTAASLRRLDDSSPDWASSLSVRVATAPADAPGLLGRYAVVGDQLVFVPRFPLEYGVSYEARFEKPAGLVCGAGSEEVVVTSLRRLPRPSAAPTRLLRVEPTAETLPENQLKFYLYFSAPMSQGEAYRHIRLIDESGAPVELAFLELEPELWDRSGTRLTLLFDPGRVKRELLPNRQVGTPLSEGSSYTLEVAGDWNDANRRALAAPFQKQFRVGAADRQSPDPDTWQLSAPAAGTREPVMIDFGESLDGALVRRLLTVVGPGGADIEGRVELRDQETRWIFHPAREWRAGTYELLIGTTLEDLAGNSVGRPFEVDRFEKVEARVLGESVSRLFEISPR